MLISPTSLFIFLIPILCFHHFSHATIPLGSTLTPSNPNTNWTSPNNTFSLTFIPILSSYSAAIIFSGITVWKAGGDSALVDSASRLELLSNGNLRLINGTGSLIWESKTSNKGVTTVNLDDFGNLSLKNGSVSVWSSFDHPTDTLLPTQSFEFTQKLQSGLYSFRLLKSGNLTLQWNNTVVYWNQGLNSSFNDANLSSPSLGFQIIGILQLSDPTISVPVNMFYSSDYGEGSDIFRFLRLDSDGNLRMYTSISGDVTEKWAAVLDQCRVYGWCGNMGVCSYNDSSPVCSCPSRDFEFFDPNDSRQGCRRIMELQDCQGNVTMLQLDHTQFLTFPPESTLQVVFIGISACRENCLVGSSCLGSTSLADGTGECYLKQSNFVSATHSLALPSTSFVKVCSPGLPNLSQSILSMSKRNSRNVPAWVVVVVIASALVGFGLVEIGLWLWCCKNNSKFGGLSTKYDLVEYYASGAPVQFSYKELQKSTKVFKEKLGAGGFGAVYKGILANRCVAAVKQLEGIEQGEKQFRMEVATISSTHHLNLVRLIGFCSEGRHRLLVYEFMKNGSLDKFLFLKDGASERLLDWQTRFNIALGTAKGITYLHEECRDCIVHCDIKPENILLDDNFNPKVSDFGLAKLIHSKDNRYRTFSVRGTRGYLAPEWLANLPITSKSDVYSYGMVLLEIISGRRNFEVAEDTNNKKFSTWAYEEFQKGNMKNVIDKRLAEHEMEMEQVRRGIEVSFWCMQEQPSQRPSMGKVVQMLEGIIIIYR